MIGALVLRTYFSMGIMNVGIPNVGISNISRLFILRHRSGLLWVYSFSGFFYNCRLILWLHLYLYPLPHLGLSKLESGQSLYWEVVWWRLNAHPTSPHQHQASHSISAKWYVFLWILRAIEPATILNQRTSTYSYVFWTISLGNKPIPHPW